MEYTVALGSGVSVLPLAETLQTLFENKTGARSGGLPGVSPYLWAFSCFHIMEGFGPALCTGNFQFVKDMKWVIK